MVVVVKTEATNTGIKLAVVIIITLTVIVILIVLWYYIILPYINILQSGEVTPTVKCTTAPSTPDGLTGVVSGNSVILTWTQTSNTDSYKIYMGRNAGFSTTLAERMITSTGNNVTVINLLPVTYYFMISAVNTCGESVVSSQISQVLTTWPTTMKICKADDPLLCLLIPNTVGQNPRVSYSCPNTGCNIDYVNQQLLALSPNDILCINENFIINPNIENFVTSQSCNVVAAQTWNLDLVTGRIDNSQGLCLGANNFAESFAFNTDCNLLVPTDSRYLWKFQPV